ncbi:hypothetical protein [Corallococcus terminator]|uniref:hypothetical protein n=1 Tax=Corallococcus terminator TaxID=2316733 RepID=UPI0011C42F76|nr:hypothetical protein [Corallococcus terminator]
MPNNPGNPGDSNNPNNLPGVMCARVYNGTGTFQRSFCATGSLGEVCRGDATVTCGDDNTGVNAATGPRSIWYQKAMDWAKQSGHPKVVLDPGVITITNATKLPADWPYHQEGVGLHVPGGIHLEGSQDYNTSPTVINVTHVKDAISLAALVLVSDTEANLPASQQLADASVSYLTLVGTTQTSYSRGQACPARGHTLNSILDLDGHEPTLAAGPWPFLTPDRLVTAGVRVNPSRNVTGAPVSLHHLKIAHLGWGIAYGFNTVYRKEDPLCQTVPGLKLTLTPKTTAKCPNNTFEKSMMLSKDAAACRPSACNADGTSAGCPAPVAFTDADRFIPNPDGGAPLPRPLDTYCVGVEETTAWGTPHYCAVEPFEFLGNPNARSQVHHNSICDVKVAVNIVGGHTDVSKNVAIRHATGAANFFGMSTDGHLPYTQSTTYTENFVSGFQLGFLTDGSQYAYMEDCTTRRLTGYNPNEFGGSEIINGFQDVLDLRQHMFDAAQPVFAQTDPLRGFIDHVYIRDNRFYKNVTGISLYRVNWGFVGFNTIDAQGAQVAPDAGLPGVSVSNTINSWIYGNTIRHFGHGIDISGAPGKQSTLGSCYNGIHTYCSDYGCPVWASYPNAFSNNGTGAEPNCNVAYNEGYCLDLASTPSPTVPGTQCFAN